MPFARRDHIRIHWRLRGEPANRVVVLLNSIGTDMSLWDEVAPFLAGYQLLQIDTRGHGLSSAPDGDYSLAMMAEDVVAVMDDASVGSATVAGVSLGGMIAMQMALDHPSRVESLIAICTSATMDPSAWDARTSTVRRDGMDAIVDLAISRFLSPGFVKDRPGIASSVADALRKMPPEGYAGCAAAIRDMDLLPRLGTLDLPTLVVTGSRDVSTPYAGHGEHLVDAIAGCRWTELECAHLAPYEVPADLAREMAGFISDAATAHGHISR